MFYGTGIGTYGWILHRNKDPERKGKIQLIDGSGQWKSMRKPMGDKRREMSKNNRDVLLEAYKAFEHAEPTISRVMTPEDFMFRDVPVYKQARFATRFSDAAVETLRARRAFTAGHLAVLKELAGPSCNDLPRVFPAPTSAAGLSPPARPPPP